MCVHGMLACDVLAWCVHMARLLAWWGDRRYRTAVEDVPVGWFTLPLGVGRRVVAGDDVTLVGWGQQVRGQSFEGFGSSKLSSLGGLLSI